jgi:hypothetical protein
MMYKVKELSDNILIISNHLGEKAVLQISGSEARFLFADPNQKIIEAAEELAGSRGCVTIIWDFCSEVRNVRRLLEEGGYDIIESKRILEVNIKQLLASKAVKKSIAINFPDTDFIPFRELMLYQLEELENTIKAADIPLTREDIARFDEDLSGIAYDEKNRIQAFILVSDKADDILIECLYGVHGNNPKYIMTALQGFAREIVRCLLTDVYEDICMLEYNETVSPLLKRLLDSKYQVRDNEKVLHAAKSLLQSGTSEETISEDKSNLRESVYLVRIQEDIAKIPYQGNINWKSCWDIKKKQ